MAFYHKISYLSRCNIFREAIFLFKDRWLTAWFMHRKMIPYRYFAGKKFKLFLINHVRMWIFYQPLKIFYLLDMNIKPWNFLFLIKKVKGMVWYHKYQRVLGTKMLFFLINSAKKCCIFFPAATKRRFIRKSSLLYYLN